MEQKIPVAPLKTCDAVLAAAGKQAALQGYPWTVCTALSAGIAGTAECYTAHHALVTVLQGYAATAARQSGKPTPDWLAAMIAAGDEAVAR